MIRVEEKMLQGWLEALMPHKSTVTRAYTKVDQSIDELRKLLSIDAPIYFMRDDHTFKKLSTDIPTAMAEIEHEFNDGYTYGYLCSKRKGFKDVHASGSANRLKFFADCQASLEAAGEIK